MESQNRLPLELRREFIVERELGTGSVGKVLLVRSQTTGNRAAIKILRNDVPREKKYFEKFSSEAAVTTKISHQNVVEIYEIGLSQDGDTPYIIMEYAEGVSLREIIKSEYLVSIDLFKEIVTQICLGLNASHSRGIIHRDIKPANVIIRLSAGRTQVKLLDFGIAKTFQKSPVTTEEAGDLYGTPGYMSPEQWRGNGVSPASDIYSLGVLMYELLTGVSPFQGKDMKDTLHRHLNFTPPSVRSYRGDVTEEIDMVIRRALEKDKTLRFRSPLEIASILNNAVFR